MALNWVQRKAGKITVGSVLRPGLMILLVGSFLALIGPYNSHQLGWPQVWFYWTGLIAFGGVVGFGAGEALTRLAPKLPEWALYLLVTALLSIPVSLAVVWLEGAIDGGFTLRNMLYTYPPVFVISSFVSAVAYAVSKLSERARQEPSPTGPGRALTDKLPHRLRRAALLSLSAEDHYLRVRTDTGDALILMRLSDAVAACESVDGARTHRSWWVAREAVTDARKGDGRGTLILTDGTEVPVSRTYYPKLRDAGWF